MEKDIQSCEWMCAKIRSSYEYAQNLYAAMCNNTFQHNDVVSILKNLEWFVSWRTAGRIVGAIRSEDYTTLYCSGYSYYYDGDAPPGIADEGEVTDEIRKDLFKIGWVVIDEETH